MNAFTKFITPSPTRHRLRHSLSIRWRRRSNSVSWWSGFGDADPYYRVAVFCIYMLTMNSLAHLGFEFFPKGFARHPIGKWFLTATHHNIHHRTFRYNYGFYFTFWDRVLGTNHPHYEDLFDDVAGRESDFDVDEVVRT